MNNKDICRITFEWHICLLSEIRGSRYIRKSNCENNSLRIGSNNHPGKGGHIEALAFSMSSYTCAVTTTLERVATLKRPGRAGLYQQDQ